MMQASRYAFIHGKIHGIMAKSYVDSRIESLLRYANLLELSRRLFPSQEVSTLERDLIRDIQRKFENQTIATLVKILSYLPKPPAILVQVLREYDYRNLKTLLRAKKTGLRDLPLWDISPYGEVPLDYDGFPENLKDTGFWDLVSRMGEKELFDLEFELDKRYYAELAGHAADLPARERKIMGPLVSLEITLQNLIWSLRLRYYFSLPWEKVEKLLFPTGYGEIPLLAKNLYALPFDEPAQWEKNRYGRILRAGQSGEITPEGAEGAGMKHLHRRIRRVFYGRPFTLSSLYAFFRLKLYEAGLVTSVSEGIRMSIPPARLAEILGTL